jgi:hypothetical protein
MDEQKKGVVPHLSKYWVMYLFIGQMIITFTTNFNQLQVLDNRVDALEKKQDSNDLVSIEVRTKLASIETSLEFIKKSVSRLDDYGVVVKNQ